MPGSNIITLQNHNTKNTGFGKRITSGFKIQLTETEEHPKDVVDTLLATLREIGVSDVNYWPYNGIGTRTN